MLFASPVIAGTLGSVVQETSGYRLQRDTWKHTFTVCVILLTDFMMIHIPQSVRLNVGGYSPVWLKG